MKVLQLTVNVEFFTVLESGKNSKKAIIIPYGPGNTTVSPKYNTDIDLEIGPLSDSVCLLLFTSVV